jgi:hypothetical protein
MDEFVPQTGGLEVREGHEESDLSIRGIVTFGVILAIAGMLTFVGVRVLISGVPYIGLEWWERKVFPVPPPLTAVEQQLRAERTRPAGPGAPTREAERRPEGYGRGDVEANLERTFPTPRLQYDDVREMEVFRGSEDDWLKSAGRDAQGNIHIPVARAMELLVEKGLPASGPFVPPTLPPAVPLVPAPAAQHK